MALWHRCRKLHSLLHGAIAAAAQVADRTGGHRRLCPGPSFLGLTPVRSFAVPVQFRPKPKEDSPTGPRLNEEITARQVRLVTDDGHSIVSRWEALDRAKKLNLDLVEGVVSLRSEENKEIRFKAKTELKDLKTKAETITRLMEHGYRVKCTAISRGKEEEDLGDLLAQILSLIEDVSIVESGPHVSAGQMYVTVRHVKFLKKKIGKKISEVIDTIRKGVQITSPEPEGEDSSDNVEVDTRHPSDVEDIVDFDARGDTSGSLKGKLELKKEPTAEREPSTVQSNRYSKPSEVRGRFQPAKLTERSGIVTDSRAVSNQGRVPQQPTRNDMDQRGQMDPKHRQVHPSNPSPPLPRFGNFISPRTAGYGGQNSTTTDKAAAPNRARAPQQPTGFEQPKQRQVNPSNPVSPSPPGDHKNYGIFSKPKPAPSGDQRKMGESDLGETGKGSPKPSYGIFSSPKNASPGNSTSSKTD